MDYTEETLNSVEVFGTTGVALSDTILFVDYGTTEGKVVFDDFINGGDGAGPEAFWVENESSIFILDSVAKRINHYINGEFADSLMLMSTIAPRCFCMADNGTVYVCDTYNGESKLFIYQENKLKNVFSIGKIDVPVLILIKMDRYKSRIGTMNIYFIFKIPICSALRKMN